MPMFIAAAIAASEDMKMTKSASPKTETGQVRLPDEGSDEKFEGTDPLSPRSQAVDDLARKAEKAISTLQFVMAEVSSDAPSKAKASFAFDTGVLWVQQLLNEARSIAAHRDAQAENI